MRKEVYLVCFSRPDLIMIVWKLARSIAHSLQFVAALIVAVLNNIYKGRVHKKKCGKSMVFYQTPPGPPPPGLVFFAGKKLTPIFFVENFIYNGQNEF